MRASTAAWRIPVTSLLYALGMTGEEILNTFYKQVPYKRAKEGWRVPFDANRLRGYKAINDLVDADTGKVVLEAGKKLTVRQARQLAEKELKALRLSDEELVGHYIAEDLVNPKTGEIYAEAGEEITGTEKKDGEWEINVGKTPLKSLIDFGYKELPLLNIDHVNVGAYIRNTLAIDKNMTREDALFQYRSRYVPGEPPTIDTAQNMFQSLFFDSERYDLSAVGRVKMNMRLDLTAEDTMRILRKEDIIAVIRTLVDLRDGKGEIDDTPPSAIAGCDRLRRTDGKSVSHRLAPHGARHQGAHVVGRYRHRDAAGFDQRQAGGRRGARVLRLLAAVSVYGSG